jgi:hypothetical protein
MLAIGARHLPLNPALQRDHPAYAHAGLRFCHGDC